MAAKKEFSIASIPLRTRNDNLERTWCFERVNNHCMPHFHLCAEAVYVEEGVMNGMISGQAIQVRAGQMVIISSYAIHNFSTPETSKVIVAVIPMDFVPIIHNRLKNRSFSCTLIEKPGADLILLMQLLLQTSSSASYETVQGLSQALLGLIIDRYGIEETLASNSTSIMHLIIPYMQQHFMEDITLDILAEHFNYSKSRLSHLFQNQLHLTFTEFLNALRCRHAATLLCTQPNSVASIAETVGFRSISTFYRVFKKQYGTSPLEYHQKVNETACSPEHS